jgi:signal transduction histidine kinase
MNVNWRAAARGWPRAAVAFARSTQPRSAVSRRAVAADVVLAAGFLVVSLIEVARLGQPGSVSVGLPEVSGHGVLELPAKDVLRPAKDLLQPGAGLGVAGVLAAVVTSVPLAARRLLPLTTFWVVLGATAMTSHHTTLATFAAVVFAAYNAVVRSRFRGPALLSLPLAAAAIMAVFPNTAPPLPARATPLILFIPILVVGNVVHVWRRRAGDSQDRLRRLAAEHAAATRRALEVERARIASELHDVVTHNVSVMVVQAGAARRVLDSAPADAREAMLAVESSGRAAMTELRHLLGLLGPPGAWDAAVPATASGNAQALSPQPGLGQLKSLIGPVTAAGLPVELHVTGTQRGLPPGLDLAAFRVIQEALTNVIKHAGRARAEIRLDYRPAELLVEIADDGTGGSAGSTPGRGLLGLRERVELYGGDLDAGLRPGGGWLVRARIPVDMQATDAASVNAASVNAASVNAASVDARPGEPAPRAPHPAAAPAGRA